MGVVHPWMRNSGNAKLLMHEATLRGQPNPRNRSLCHSSFFEVFLGVGQRMSHTPCSCGGVKNTNPNHNIWNNNGTWWCHYTVHNDDYTKQRVRVSLGTDDIEIARALRDFLMQATPKIAARIPRARGQAMPDVGPDVRESRAVSRRSDFSQIAGAAY